MSKSTNRSVRNLLAAAAAFAAAGALPPATAHAAQSGVASEPSEQRLLHAAELLEQGRPVRARAILMDLMAGGGAAMADRERQQGYDLLTRAVRAARELPAAELSLQKAELALAQGELLSAERQARGVSELADVSPQRLLRAERVLEGIAQRRIELEPLVGRSLEAAEGRLAEGDFAGAKKELSWVAASGVEMDLAQRDRLAGLQVRIVDAERRRGSLFEGETLSMGAMQPGVEPDQPPAEPVEPLDDPASEFQPLQPDQDPDRMEQPPEQPLDDLIGEANRQEIQRLMARAEQAAGEQRYSDALELLRQVQSQYGASLTPQERVQVEDRITDLQLRLRQETPGALDETIVQLEQARQEARATFENLLLQSRQALETGDVDGARERALEAQVRLRNRATLFSQSEFDTREARVSQQLAQIDSRAEQIRREEAARLEGEARREAQAAARAQERETQRRIDEAIIRVRELQMDQKYREALDVIRQQVLFLDPRNPTGLLLQDILHDTIIFTESREFMRLKRRNFADLSLENLEASIPPVHMIEYPKDWPQISFLRSPESQFSESPEDRAVLASIQERRLPTVQFTSNTLEEVMGFLETVAQVNIDVDWQALEAINIGRDDTVSLSLRNVPVQTVLDRVLEKVSTADFGEEAAWAVQDGVLVVSSDEQIRRNTVLEIYDIRDLVVDVPDYTNAPEFDLNQVLQQSGGGGGGGGGGQSPFQSNQQDQFTVRPLEERLDLMKDIIREVVDPSGWRELGGDTGFIQDWNGQLIITNTPANHRQIQGLLSRLREQRAIQINVEARFMLVNQDFFEQIGFDLDVIFNTDSNQVIAAQGIDPNTRPGDFFNFGQGGLQRIVAVPTVTPDGDVTVNNVTAVPPDKWSPVGTVQNSLGLAGALAPATDFASNILGSAPALGVAGTFLDDIQVDFLIRATQADRRSISLTAPRLTFTNGQTSNIYVVTQIGFVSDLQPIVSDSAVGFDPTIDVLSEGVRLIVDGIVSADRRFVTMNVDAALAQIEGFEQQPVTAVAGGQLIQSEDVTSFIQVPTTTVTRVQTTATVPDQGTILLGGQRLVSEFEVETGVPVLSKIPVINRFFTNRITAKEESTLMVLLKPTVLIQSEQEELQFPGLVDTLGSSFGG